MENLSFEEQGEIGILRINRPQAHNALNSKLLEELLAWLKQERNVKIVIITGQGEKAFIAGADIKEMAALDATTSQKFCALGQQVTLQIEQASFVTIAAVNGFALGGGLEIALACDFIYAAKNAKLGLPEVSLGLIPGFGGTQRLARAVGSRRAKELIMTGKKISAEDAFRMGLVNKVCHDHALLADCRHTAEAILKNSFACIIAAKHALDSGYHLDIESALGIEQKAFTNCFNSPDRIEGMGAFLDKRTPNFYGVPTC